MPPGEFDMLWPIASRGYYWADDLRPIPGSDGSPPPFLVAAPNVEGKIEGRLYRPLETTAELYLRFAELIEKGNLQDAIAEFAGLYGALGVDEPIWSKRQGSPVIHGESLANWKLELRWFTQALTLWESSDKRWLRKHIRWRSGGVDFVSPAGDMAIIADRDKRVRPEVFQQWSRGDLEGPARVHLIATVNKKLRGQASPQLAVNGTDIEPRTVPHSLLAAIWLQLFDLIHGAKRARRCGVCHRLMDVTGEKRPRRMHPNCSTRKRQQAFKERHERGN